MERGVEGGWGRGEGKGKVRKENGKKGEEEDEKRRGYWEGGRGKGIGVCHFSQKDENNKRQFGLIHVFMLRWYCNSLIMCVG